MCDYPELCWQKKDNLLRCREDILWRICDSVMKVRWKVPLFRLHRYQIIKKGGVILWEEVELQPALARPFWQPVLFCQMWYRHSRRRQAFPRKISLWTRLKIFLVLKTAYPKWSVWKGIWDLSGCGMRRIRHMQTIHMWIRISRLFRIRWLSPGRKRMFWIRRQGFTGTVRLITEEQRITRRRRSVWRIRCWL